MSFRYTNKMVGLWKQRILLEQYRRQLLPLIFVGSSGGVEVTYTAHGLVRNIRVINEATFRKNDGELDVEKLSAAIKLSVWDANQKLRASKEECYRRSFQYNEQIRNAGDYKVWFLEDAGTLGPHAYDYVRDVINSTRAVDGGGHNFTMADAMPLMAPILLPLQKCNGQMLEAQAAQDTSKSEEYFWRRVELIRKSQQSVNAANKPSVATTIKEDDKIKLRFTNTTMSA